MIERLTDKIKPCTYCTQYGHTAWKCPRKARMQMKRSYIQRGTKRLKPESAKHKANRQATNAKWFELNGDGPWDCYLQVVPDCERTVTKETVNIEHPLSKARHPELRWNARRLKPACSPCNKFKGSKDFVDGVLV
jgi:hypothetical protein